MSHRTVTPQGLLKALNGDTDTDEPEYAECEWCGERLRFEQAPFVLVPVEQIDGGDWHYGCWRSYQNALALRMLALLPKERLS